jgi:hypothetical protein
MLEDLARENVVGSYPSRGSERRHLARLTIVSYQLDSAATSELIRVQNRQLRHALRPRSNHGLVQFFGD